MKNLFLILSTALILFSCTSKEASEFQSQKQGTQKPGKGGGNGGSEVTVAGLPLTATLFTTDSIVLDWEAPTLTDGRQVLDFAVQREYTQPDGTVYLLDDPYGNGKIRGSEWQIVSALAPGEPLHDPSISKYTVKDTRPLSWTDILSGTYRFRVSGKFGYPWETLTSEGYITNIVSITIP